ncbi:MAG TPA: hypothetical protein VE130_06250 [Nitrososphaeraceae archaeon]|nr:hypothetical protein [Nitrososphaeraceae archaeon]
MLDDHGMIPSYFAILSKSFSFALLIVFALYILAYISWIDLGYALSSSKNTNNIELEENLEIIDTIPFNNTSLSSIVVDTLRNLVYVSANPVYPYDNTTFSCTEEEKKENNSDSLPTILNSISACSAIYVIDGDSGQIKNIIRLRPGELIRDIDINPHSGKIYAAGEYNYLGNDSYADVDGRTIQYEDDVVYIIDEAAGPPTGNEITRIKLYGEVDDGKEGDMSSIAVDTHTNTIYAGIRYFMGGREGVFVIYDSNDTIDGSNNININNNNTIKISNLEFIPLGETGPDQIIVGNNTTTTTITNTVYASLKYDDFIALIDGSNKTVKKQVILQDPRAMSLNPTNNLLYVASGDSYWFNIINTTTNEVIAANKQISYPIASVTNNITGKVYVVECHRCNVFDLINGSSIYELFSNGSTVTWRTYEDIDIEENGLAINPFTNRLYAIGNDIQSGRSNLYVIDISSSSQ